MYLKGKSVASVLRWNLGAPPSPVDLTESRGSIPGKPAAWGRFMHELEYGGEPGRFDVTLRVRIATDGTVEWSGTAGEVAPAITACLDREVETWTFWTGTSDRAEVSYGIHFVLNSW